MKNRFASAMVNLKSPCPLLRPNLKAVNSTPEVKKCVRYW
jgi:hypothetical protein